MYAGLAPHIEAVAGHASSYPICVKDIVLRDLGIYFSASGQRGQPALTLNASWPSAESAYGPGHPKIAKALGNLGGAQLRLGSMSDARANFERSLAILQGSLWPRPPEVARALCDLGILHRMRLGKLGTPESALNAPWPSSKRLTAATILRSPRLSSI